MSDNDYPWHEHSHLPQPVLGIHQHGDFWHDHRSDGVVYYPERPIVVRPPPDDAS